MKQSLSTCIHTTTDSRVPRRIIISLAFLSIAGCSDTFFKGSDRVVGAQQSSSRAAGEADSVPEKKAVAAGEGAGSSRSVPSPESATATGKVTFGSGPEPVCSLLRRVPDEIKTYSPAVDSLTALVVTDSGYGCDGGNVEVHIAKESVSLNLVLHSWSATNWRIYNPYNVDIKSILVHSCSPVFRSGSADVVLSASTASGFYGPVPSAIVSTDPKICEWRRSWPKNDFWYSLTLRPDVDQLMENLNSVLKLPKPISKVYYSSENFRHLEINSAVQNCSYYDPKNICQKMYFTSTIFGGINHNGQDDNSLEMGHGEYKRQ